MEQVPDAPWIRDAETNGVGYDGPDRMLCPICSEECETIYKEPLGRDAIGCEHCLLEVELKATCPECEAAAEIIYFEMFGRRVPGKMSINPVGCDKCVVKVDAWKYWEEEPE